MKGHTPLPWTRKSWEGDKGRLLVGPKNENGVPVLVADLYADHVAPVSLPDRSEYRANGELILKALEAFQLSCLIARLFKEGDQRDLGDGCPPEEYCPSGNDDDVDALYSLISEARRITGCRPDTLVEEVAA
jgi:hypothetical protein